MNRINVRQGLRERVFFYLVFLILIILVLLMIEPFFTVLIVSLISVIILKPLYDYFWGLKWVNERKGVAVTLTLVTVFVLLIIPVLFLVRTTANQLAGLFESLASLDVDAIMQEIQQSLAGLPVVGDAQPVETSANESVQPVAHSVAQGLAQFAISLGSSLPNLITQALIFIVVVATLLPVYDILIPKLEEISPLGQELAELYNRKMTAMVKSLVLGVFLIAFIQGLAMGLFYWLAGLQYVFLLTLISMFLALIPVVGISWLVIGIAVVSFLTGNWEQGVIVLFGFYGVVNWIDILLRPKLIAEEASINFALFILAIFAGIAWAGVMGLFYGPVIMLLLVTTVHIYAERYANEDMDLLGDALSGLGSDGEGSEPETEAGQAAESTAPADGSDNEEPPSQDVAADG